MIGIQLISHGALASGMLDAVQLIVGEVEQLACLSLNAEADTASFQVEMAAQSRKLDSGQGVLVFVDMYGATPYNLALLNGRESSAERYQVVAGFNLPLVIEAILQRETEKLPTLVANLKLGASDSIIIQ